MLADPIHYPPPKLGGIMSTPTEHSVSFPVLSVLPPSTRVKLLGVCLANSVVPLEGEAM